MAAMPLAERPEQRSPSETAGGLQRVARPASGCFGLAGGRGGLGVSKGDRFFARTQSPGILEALADPEQRSQSAVESSA